jgi:hypothetical protein
LGRGGWSVAVRNGAGDGIASARWCFKLERDELEHEAIEQ